jgi:hypothetical protein
MSDAPHALSSHAIVDHLVDPTILDRIVLRPNPDVQGTNMDGETVILDLSTGRYYTLNRLGSVIWEYCTGHTPSATSMRSSVNVLMSSLNEPLTISSPW